METIKSPNKSFQPTVNTSAEFKRYKVCEIKLILLILLVPTLLAMSEVEETLVAEDSHVFNALVSELDKTNLEFRVEGTTQIFYPISLRDEFIAIQKRVWSKFYSDCGGKFNNPEMHNKLAKELEARNIPFSVVIDDQGEKFICPSEYKKGFSEAFRYILFAKE